LTETVGFGETGQRGTALEEVTVVEARRDEIRHYEAK
jgi:hypothetical protein